MGKLKTNQELLIQNQQYAFKLRDLYLKDQEMFNQINDYIPYSIYINDQETLDIEYANDRLLKKGPEMELLKEKGSSYLSEISCPVLLKFAKKRTVRFKYANDFDSVCSFLQAQRVNGEMKYLYSNKLILDDAKFFNVSNFFEDFGCIGKVIENILKPFEGDHTTWLKFQSLTKREKEVLKLFANGFSKNEIAEKLCISPHSVHTHRRNIYKKLDFHKVSELYRFAIMLDLL